MELDYFKVYELSPKFLFLIRSLLFPHSIVNNQRYFLARFWYYDSFLFFHYWNLGYLIARDLIFSFRADF